MLIYKSMTTNKISTTIRSIEAIWVENNSFKGNLKQG